MNSTIPQQQGPHLPPVVTRFMRLLHELTGDEATCDTSVRGQYVIEHGDPDRLRMTFTFRRNSQGRFSESSTLTQNGEPRPLVPDIDAYARLYADPTLKHPARKPVAPLPDPIPIPEGEEMPTLVAHFYGLGKTGSGKTEGRSITVGRPPAVRQERRTQNPRGRKAANVEWVMEGGEDARPDPERYVIDIRKGDGERVQMYFAPVKQGSEAYGLVAMSAVDENGCDMMAEHAGNLTGALESILGFRMPSDTESPAPARRPVNTAGAVSNAVNVRRASVIRN